MAAAGKRSSRHQIKAKQQVSAGLFLALLGCCWVAGAAAAVAPGRRALRSSNDAEALQQQILGAVEAGDFELAQSLRSRQLSAAGRSLLQIVTPSCTTLAGVNPLVPCADPACRTYNLVRQADGSIRCVGPTPRPPGTVAPVAVQEFSYPGIYDYDVFFDTDGDLVLAGASSNFKTSTVDQFASKVGSAGLSSSTETTFENRLIENPLLGFKADTGSTVVPFNTEFSVGSDAKKPAILTDKTNSGFEAASTFGAYMPGTKATARDVKDGGSDSQVVFTANRPALFGYIGKKRSQ